MSIKYMEDKNCIALRFKDAYTYVKVVCKGSNMEAAVAWLFGRNVKIVAGHCYVPDDSTSSFSDRFRSVLLTRNIKLTTDSHHLSTEKNNSNEHTRLLNEENHARLLNEENHAHLLEEKNNLKKKNESLSEEIKNLNVRNSKMESDLSYLQSQLTSKIKQLSELCTTMNTVNAENQQLKKNIANLDDKIKALPDQQPKMDEKDKSTNKNATSTDLTNPNRTDKLATRFSQIYDEQWTPLLEKLDAIEEEKAITLMATMIREAHTKAKNWITNEKQKATTENIHLSEKDIDNKKINKEITQDDLLANITKHINNSLSKNPDTLIAIATSATNDLITQKYNEHDSEELRNYLNSLIQFMILMELQPSPFEFAWLHKNDEYDSNVFKEYKNAKSKFIDYLVWPALLLHKQGLLVAKGVVQPTVSVPQNDIK